MLISIIGFGFMHFANALIFIYVARFICGLAVGIIFAVVPVYLGEIAEDKNRGVLGMFLGIFIMSGILFTNAIGSVVTLNTLNLVNFAAPILFMASFDWFVPESPYWLVAQKRFKDAEKSLRKIRQCPEDKLNTELEMIKKNIQETFNDGTSLKDWLRKKEFLRGIFITCSLVTFQQLSGINIILFYMQSIFEETGSSLPSDLSTIIISVVQILACTISSIFIDNLGRKILLIFSGVGTCLSLIAFGVYFYLKEAHLSVDEIFWLPIVSIIFFMIAYASGFGPVPFVVLSEVFQQRIKSSASTITIFVCLIGTFCTTTFFPPIITYLGMSYVFWMLAVFCFISAVFTFWFVPETKGKSLQEIQQMMQK